MALVTVCFVLLAQLFRLSWSNGMLLLVLALTLQLNDYSGTIEPHVGFNMRNENSLGFLGASSLVRNSILIYVLTLLMPDTRTTSTNTNYQLLFGLYHLVTPLLCCLVVCIPTTLVLKEGRYQQLSESITSNFDLSITLMSPIFCYLICETLSASGCQALICCGLFQGIYGWKNIQERQLLVVESTVRYVSFLMRQIGCVVIGILAPFYFRFKMPMSTVNLLIFTVLTFLVHLLFTLVTVKLFKAVNQYKALNSAEVQV